MGAVEAEAKPSHSALRALLALSSPGLSGARFFVGRGVDFSIGCVYIDCQIARQLCGAALTGRDGMTIDKREARAVGAER